MRCVISVLGGDRTGIIAGVSATLVECGANIVDVSQTIVDGVFSMTMIVVLNEEIDAFNATQEELSKTAEDLGVQIKIQREDVFKFMYQV